MEVEKYVFKDGGGRFVQLDIELTEELLLEGYANELCANVMALRKEKDCALDDTLNILFVTNNQTLVEVIEKYKDMIFDRLICNTIGIAATDASFTRIELHKDATKSTVYFSAMVNINDKGKLTFQTF